MPFSKNSWRFLSSNVRSKISEIDIRKDLVFLLLINSWFAIGVQWLSFLWTLWEKKVTEEFIVFYIIYGLIVWGSFSALMSFDAEKFRMKPYRISYYKIFPTAHAFITGTITYLLN